MFKQRHLGAFGLSKKGGCILTEWGAEGIVGGAMERRVGCSSFRCPLVVFGLRSDARRGILVHLINTFSSL